MIIFYDFIKFGKKLVLETPNIIELPYLAGKVVKDIRYKDPKWTETEGDFTEGYTQTIGYESKDYNSSLFNENGLMSLVMAVEENTLIYIQVRSDHVLEEIIISPDSIIPDIHYSTENKLLYSFYNLSFNGNLCIKGKLLPDVNDYYNKLRKAPEDLTWREYLIKKSLADSRTFPDPEKIENASDMIIASEAAAVLGMAEKTVRNWTSEGKIPYIKVGRSVKYSRKALESYIQKNSYSPKKRK